MELYQINQFLAFARCGNMTRAAEETHTSQPALSRAMKRLEEELEVPLFMRTKNTVALNSYGELAAECAKKIADGVEAMQRLVKERYRAEHTVVIASCAPAPLWTLPQIARKWYPDNEITAELADITEIRAGLESGAVQIGVFAGEVSDGAFFCKRFGTERLFFSVPKSHPLSGRESVSFADIDGETMLLMSDIGIWHEVHTHKMPHSHFLLQNERSDFSTLVSKSELPSFTSDLAMNHPDFPSERVNIPISDKEATATYYAVCRKSEYARFRIFFDAL